MRVLVTGHHGYIGSVAVPILMAAGHEVTGLDTFLYGGCDLLPGIEIPHLRMDIRDVRPKVSAGSKPSFIWRRCRTTRWVICVQS